MKNLQKFYPHLLALLGFIVIALVYFYPVLQGKQLYQSDIAQYTGMAKEQNDFRETHHTEPYWTNSAFGGMPTYQLGANYPHNYIKKLDALIRFLPRPADYLFLYFIGFYALLLTLKIDPLKAFFGALAFGFSTYLVIILGVGHNAKAHAIAYMPLVVAGFIMVFRRKYVWGGILTMLAVALEINANHFQMTYYLLLLLLVMTIVYFYKFIREKEYKTIASVSGVLAIAAVFAIGANAANLMATAEYTNFSMRGKSELTFKADGSKNNTDSAMDYDYITEYSYGVAESLNLISPRLFGGGNSDHLGKDSAIHEFILGEGATEEEAMQFTESYGRTYWGDQPIVAAPAYIGAVVFFLAVLGLFTDDRKVKYAFLGGAILSLLLSWGKNFPLLTDFFIHYVPLYDKFRAVSSIQVILELCMPALAAMGLYSFFKKDKSEQFAPLWKSAAITLGLLLLLIVLKGMFSFSAASDDQLLGLFSKMGDPAFGQSFMKALKEDRMTMYTADLLRSLFFVAAVVLVLWLCMKEKLGQFAGVVIIGLLMLTDLVVVDKKYVDNTGFVSASQVREPFQPTEADLEILKDKSNYRVYDFQGRLQGRASYFHKAVGGYSAVRPRRYDQLFDYQIDKQLVNLDKMVDPQTLSLTKNIPLLDALNIKYLIFAAGDKQVPITNPFANGDAWFVGKVDFVNSADEEMKAVGNFDSKNVAIVNKTYQKQAAMQPVTPDSTTTIKTVSYEPNAITYKTHNTRNAVAVFSEVYYPKGWKATIDGKETEIFPADYVLRAINIPAGDHTVEFKFEPQVVKTGGTIALFSCIGMLLLIGGGIYTENKKEKEKAAGNKKA